MVSAVTSAARKRGMGSGPAGSNRRIQTHLCLRCVGESQRSGNKVASYRNCSDASVPCSAGQPGTGCDWIDGHRPVQQLLRHLYGEVPGAISVDDVGSVLNFSLTLERASPATVQALSSSLGKLPQGTTLAILDRRAGGQAACRRGRSWCSEFARLGIRKLAGRPLPSHTAPGCSSWWCAAR